MWGPLVCALNTAHQGLSELRIRIQPRSLKSHLASHSDFVVESRSVDWGLLDTVVEQHPNLKLIELHLPAMLRHFDNVLREIRKRLGLLLWSGSWRILVCVLTPQVSVHYSAYDTPNSQSRYV